MTVRNCQRCGKVFLSAGGKRICPACVQAEQDEFESVREYLRRHPKALLMEVSQATGVPAKKIWEYVREGRLLANGAAWGLTCERCGTPIETGRFCLECSAKMERELRAARPQTDPTYFTSEKKYTWNRFRRR